jgi:hypothetical protein
MSFLSVFQTVLHVIEAAAKIAAPLIATQDPIIGALMTQANNAAIGIEAAIITPGTGEQKATVVAAQSQATIDVINGILASQNKPPLPANTNTIVQAGVKTVIGGLNAVAQAVTPPKA